MSDDWDPTKICRDEECEIEEVHRAHRRLKRRPVISSVHHRPRSNAPLAPGSIADGRLAQPGELLAERVLLAIGERPTMMQWIARDVRDDYGRVSSRSIHRYVKRLVQESKIVKLDLNLTFPVYIRSHSRLLDDRGALREYMLSNAACLPACTKDGAA